jgi:NADH-quinone oxidoreductase subunit G
MNARAMLADPRRAYIVLHAEPELDCASPVAARAALEKADFVVVLSPFRHALSYADVLLPVAPFTETAGTFVNCEGRVQSFKGVVKPYAETRPGWKVLRVLGTLLGLPGFDFDTAEAARASVLPAASDVAARLRNSTRVGIVAPGAAVNGLERIADVPIHFADPLVRRSVPLQRTADAAPPRARMNPVTLAQVGATEGAQVKVIQGGGEAVLTAVADAAVPPGVVRIAAAHPSTCGLEGLSGPIRVERVAG